MVTITIKKNTIKQKLPTQFPRLKYIVVQTNTCDYKEKTQKRVIFS